MPDRLTPERLAEIRALAASDTTAWLRARGHGPNGHVPDGECGPCEIVRTLYEMAHNTAALLAHAEALEAEVAALRRVAEAARVLRRAISEPGSDIPCTCGMSEEHGGLCEIHQTDALDAALAALEPRP